MRKSKFTESQILAILGEVETGLAVEEVCRKNGISTATYYQWKSKYAGMSANELRWGKAGGREQPFQTDVCGSGFGERCPSKMCSSDSCDAESQVLCSLEHGVLASYFSSKACQILGFSRSALYKPTALSGQGCASACCAQRDGEQAQPQGAFGNAFIDLGLMGVNVNKNDKLLYRLSKFPLKYSHVRTNGFRAPTATEQS